MLELSFGGNGGKGLPKRLFLSVAMIALMNMMSSLALTTLVTSERAMQNASKYSATTFDIANIIFINYTVSATILVIITMEFLLVHWRVGCESTPRPVPLLGSTAPEPFHSSH